jgi:nitroimidazol reductase NimA-like FMN-containing flavoprotein (pyridoxamine 5'-phosphate oxidase superfamily)
MPRPQLSMTAEEIGHFLLEPHVAVLSTIDGRGFPHSVGMYYVPKDEAILMYPYGKSQKVVNVRRNPHCAVLIEAGTPYQDLKGVLIRGRATVDDDPERVFDLARELYERYWLPTTGVAFDDGPADAMKGQATKRVCLEITRESVASWDHSKG